jgi:hypothetical protein
MISTRDSCGEILSHEALSLFYGIGERGGGPPNHEYVKLEAWVLLFS